MRSFEKRKVAFVRKKVPAASDLKVEMISVEDLKPHPRNYRQHPDDQLDHMIESIRKNGFYRNVVIAQDNTILAGHGVVAAASKMKLKELPVFRLPFASDDPRSLKVLTGDNEIAKLSIIDDRALTDMLKEIKETNLGDLLGTGFDDRMLAALAMITRSESEIRDFNEAAEWAGMPNYTEEKHRFKLVISFEDEKSREKFMRLIKAKVVNSIMGRVLSIWWPEKENTNNKTERFEG